MRIIIVNFHGLHLNTQILVIPLICILYLSSLVLRNLVLLLYCFIFPRNLILLLYYFAHLCLMRHSCYMRSLDFLVYLIQKVLCYKHLLIFHVNQSLHYLKCLKCLECLKHFKYLKHPIYPKRFEYLKYFQSWFVYLTFCPLNPNFCLVCLKVFLGRV